MAYLRVTERRKFWRLIAKMAWSVVAILLLPAAVFAGGGPENLVLVVNADSAASKLIANHYIRGRQIPTRNVIYLNGIPFLEKMILHDFRETILKPVIQQIEERKIANSIDYIVYSADFPTIIDVNVHVSQLMAESKKGGVEIPAQIFYPEASINSLTYFAGAVLMDQPGYLLLDANTYYRQPAEKILRQPFVGDLQNEFEAAIAAINKPKTEFEAARKQLEAMVSRNPRQVALLYWMARFHAKTGNAREASKWMAAAIRMGWGFRSQTRSDLAFSKIRNDPVFKGIVERIPDEPFKFVSTHGFKQSYPWGINGMLNNEAGQGNRYFLSTVLAVTRNFGTNEREALRQLNASINADATSPTGTFYFSDTADVRNTTRKPNYQVAIDALQRLGQKSEIITTSLPMQKNDVLGLTTGTPTFTWTESGSRFVHGAIGDNLTSFGGVMVEDSQTKISEFIRNDSAGASGTVIEPFALQAKFPHPLIHAHYAAGCSLAEAFYQSISGPFQTLIVGDALCQPWASRPVLKVDGISAGDTIKGTVKLSLNATDSPVPIAGFEMYVDGVLVLREKLRQRIAFDTSGIADGFHELRLVAVANNPIETTGRVVLPILVDNNGHSTELTTPRTDYIETDTITFNVKSNFGDSVELTHNTRSIAKKIGREAEFQIPAALLGRGPVAIEAIAIDEAGAVVASLPLEFKIEGRLSEHNKMTAGK